MKLKQILEVITKMFVGIEVGGEKGDLKLAALDRGVLTVGLLLAAIDGAILPEEFAAFRTLAKKCRGGSTRNVRALLDEALPTAGQLMAMAQVGVYSEKERLAAFVMATEKALPDGFKEGSLADLRRAFVLWVTVCVADGTFSEIEKEAMTALVERYAEIRLPRAQQADVSKDGLQLLEQDFLAKAEKIARDLSVPSKKAKAEGTLEELIETMVTVDDRGNSTAQSTSVISVQLAMMAMIGLMTGLVDKITVIR